MISTQILRFSEPGWKQSSIYTGSHLYSYNPTFSGLDSAKCVSFFPPLGTLKSLPQPSTPFVLPSVAASLQHPMLPSNTIVLHLGWVAPAEQRGPGCSPPTRQQLCSKGLGVKDNKLNMSQQCVHAAESQPCTGLYQECSQPHKASNYSSVWHLWDHNWILCPVWDYPVTRQVLTSLAQRTGPDFSQRHTAIGQEAIDKSCKKGNCLYVRKTAPQGNKG